jgi:hypothetical protein
MPHKKTQGTQGRSTKTKTPVVSMRSRDGMLVAAKLDKVNNVNIQTMIDNHTDSILCPINHDDFWVIPSSCAS